MPVLVITFIITMTEPEWRKTLFGFIIKVSVSCDGDIMTTEEKQKQELHATNQNAYLSSAAHKETSRR